MRTFLFVTIFTLQFSLVNSQTAWQLQSPLPTQERLETSFFFDVNTGYAAGEKGTIIFTSDAGQNWNLQESGTTKLLKSVYFISSQTGWCTGDNVIIKTTNGGKKWNVQYVDSNLFLQSIFFINNNSGWTAGRHGKIYSTTNGGTNWDLSFSDSAFYFSSVYFSTPLNGFAAGTGSNNASILRTSNGGISWIPENIPSGIILSVDFISQDVGYCSDTQGNIFKTTNGGVNWNYLSRVALSSIYNISFSSELSGWAISQQIRGFYRTTDGGFNWTRIQIDDELLNENTLNTVELMSADTGWIFGSSGMILISKDGGLSWNSQNNGTPHLTSVFFNDHLNGWAAGQFGTILHTTNGGEKWIHQESGQNRNLSSIFFTSATTGYFTGDSVILKTTNSGSNWSIRYSDTSEFLTSVFFTSPSTGWITSYNGSILYTSDAGDNWIRQEYLPNYNLMSVYFVSPQTGWITGLGGTILKTSNSGVNWNLQNSGINHPYSSIAFTSPNTGWITGAYLYKTTNGGINWDYSPINGNPYTFDVFFVNPNVGYACGFNVYKTSNAGMNWYLSQIESVNELQSIFFISPETGWVVGNNGIIFKTTNGGEPVGISSNELAVPNRFFLYQNYPNPFNPNTKIKYDLKTAGNVSLKVFDILGRKISELVNQRQNAGTYEVEFDAANLSSGIYFYRIETGGFIETKRMVVLK